MNKFKIKKTKERTLVWNKVRFYVDFVILICCFIIAINIHPSSISNSLTDNGNLTETSGKMIYIFHDYEWNEYIMNDSIHWSSSSWDYLFEDEIPDNIKWDEEKNEDSVSIWELFEESDDNSNMWYEENNSSDSIKTNQISIEEIMADLWMDNLENSSVVSPENDENTDQQDNNYVEDSESELWKMDSDSSDEEIIDDEDDALTLDVWNYDSDGNMYEDSIYIVTEETWADNNSLIIEKIDNNWDIENGNVMDNENLVNNQDVIENENSMNDKNNGLLTAQTFTFVEEWWVLPTLVSWDDLFYKTSDGSLAYIDNHTSDKKADNWYNTDNEVKKSGITIIDDYADCMTPWWYKIKHWESVLAYKQMDNALDICNIERRFCRKWKLSGTYTQQWCSVNKNYSYEERWRAEATNTKKWWTSSASSSKQESNWSTRQNTNWTVNVRNSESSGSFVFDRPSGVYTDYTTGKSDNIRQEDPEVEQTDRPLWNCTAPRWEKVKHWQFVQAFKHKNWFSDLPCEFQFRLCTMWDLMWTFTESSCKTWDTSFVDWVYGSPTRETYSEWKLNLVKEQIESDEKKYNKDRKKIWRLENDDDLDELLYILDDNY